MKKVIQKIPIQITRKLTGSNSKAQTGSRKIGLREAIKFANRLDRHHKNIKNEKKIAFSIQERILK